jgi:hypothetical protein
MGVPSSPNSEGCVSLPWIRHCIIDLSVVHIRQRYEKIVFKISGCKPTRFQEMAVLISDRITKQPISFGAPLDHRMKNMMGHESTCADP